MHMFFNCSLYEKRRENFFKKKQDWILKLNYDAFDNSDTFCLNLFETSNKSSLQCIGNFINQCFFY